MKTGDQGEQSMFSEQWGIYMGVIDNNYMYHRELVDVVKEQVSRFAQSSVLDLGCGDSHVIARSLGNDQEIVYCGVDSADMALEYAKAKLEKVRGEVNLVHEDLMSALKGMKGRYDIIISGYSLHHLDAEKKEECFSLIAKLLSDQGVFIFYDLEMKPDETPSQYIDRACQLMTSEWTKFDEKTLKDIREHVEENDLPENESFYLESFDRFGMSEVEKVFRDKDELFAAYLARKVA